MVGNLHFRVWEQELCHPAHGFVHGLDIASAQCAPKVHATLHHRHPAARAHLRPALAQEVAYQPKVIRQVNVWVQLRKIPAGNVGVKAVVECSVVAHFRRQRTQQVPDLLLLQNVHVEVSNHHHATLGTDALLAAREFARRHVALEDVHAVFLVERHAGHFVEAHHVVMADQTTLPAGVVHKHLCHRRFATGDEVRIR